eukprot:353461_1
MECSDFDCFWNNCKGWTITWITTGVLEFVCGCWALIELIHIYASIYRIKHASIGILRNHQNDSNYNLIRNQESDHFTPSYMISFNNNTPSSIATSTSIYNDQSPTSPTHRPQMQMFDTRLSQKLFLFIIFIGGMSRAYLFIDTPFTFTHCNMIKVDKPNLVYALLGDITPNLFFYAFSCLGYALSKIYFEIQYPKGYHNEARIRSIKRSFCFVVSLTILVTIPTVAVDIYFILYFEDKDKYKNMADMIDSVGFYAYGCFCLLLGIYFIRFAFPIYAIYKRILHAVQYQRTKNPTIESSMSSDPATFTDEIHTAKIRNKHKHSSNLHSTGEFHSDTLNYFVSSMKRTWLMALYCGLAFSMRSVIILAVSDELEDKYYVLAPYQLLFEILPNLMMLYIYHHSTKNMAERYSAPVINR